MEKGAIIEAVSRFTEDELTATPDYFLVETKVSPSNQLQVFVDADHGAAIDRLAKINRAIYKRIAEAELFGKEGNFSLEVSSPGLEEPLKLLRQYKKNIGRRVELSLSDDSRQEGMLKDVNENILLLEYQTGTKKDKRTEQMEIPFNQIKFTKVCVVF